MYLIDWSYRINQVSVGVSLKKIQQKSYPGILPECVFATPFKVVPHIQ